MHGALVHELHRGLWIGGNGDYSGLLLCGKAVSKLSGVYITTHQLVNKKNTQKEVLCFGRELLVSE